MVYFAMLKNFRKSCKRLDAQCTERNTNPVAGGFATWLAFFLKAAAGAWMRPKIVEKGHPGP